MKSNYTKVSGVVFALVAILQTVRALAGWSVQIGAFNVPVLFSWVAATTAGGLAVWAFKVPRLH